MKYLFTYELFQISLVLSNNCVFFWLFHLLISSSFYNDSMMPMIWNCINESFDIEVS